MALLSADDAVRYTRFTMGIIPVQGFFEQYVTGFSLE